MNKCRKKVNTKKWSDLKQIFSFKEGGYLKSETSIEILPGKIVDSTDVS